MPLLMRIDSNSSRRDLSAFDCACYILQVATIAVEN